MMNKTVNAADVENLQFKLKCAVGCVDAIHTAMADSPIAPEAFVDALFGAVTHLQYLVDEMERLYISESDMRGGV